MALWSQSLNRLSSTSTCIPDPSPDVVLILTTLAAVQMRSARRSTHKTLLRLSTPQAALGGILSRRVAPGDITALPKMR